MRYYSNLAGQMTLTNAVGDSDITLTLSTVTGLPASYPFTLVVDVGTPTEEVVTVNSVFGLNVSVTRGQDGTSPVSHDVATVIRHMATARDYSEPQAHISDTSAVHGVSGDVVGTSDSQILANKSISGLTSAISDVQKASLPADSVYLATAQTLTSKTMDGAVNTFTNVPKTALPTDTVYLATAQTLAGKSISGATNTLSAIPADTALVNRVPKANLPTDTAYATDVTPGAFLASESGWTNASSYVRVLNGMAFIRLAYTRSGGTITCAASTGSVTDNQIATMNTGYRPSVEVEGACRYGGTSGGFCRLISTGEVYFIHGSPGIDLLNGDSLIVSFVYPV